MASFQRILLPADGSEHSRRATATGLDLAKRLKVPVVALYVVDARALDPYPSEALFVDLRSILLKEARRTLARVEADARRKKIRATTRLLEGVPEEEIVRFAKPSDLIVMATHGRTGLSRLLLGSVAETVVRHARCPVLVVRTGRS